MTPDLVEASIATLQSALARGESTSYDLVGRYLRRIDAYNTRGPCLAAYLILNPDALSTASELDEERRAKGARGPLHGIPIAVKDNYAMAGLPMTAGSAALRGLVAQEDAFVVSRLREAGAVILGKTNLHELAAGITTVGSAGGATRNPYNPERNPGGSSGGTAAAVAANLCTVAMGSDTCGSIRIPAAQCSLVGLRPSQGLTSRAGIVPLSLTQDVVGPLARSISDLAVVLDTIVGEDPNDPNTAVARNRRFGFVDALDASAIKGARIGRLDTLFSTGPADTPVADVVHAALKRAENAGAEVVAVTLPQLDSLLDLGFTVLLGEVADDLADFLRRNPTAPVRSLAELLATGCVHPEVEPVLVAAINTQRRNGSEYKAAIKSRSTLRDGLMRLMDTHKLDALAYPTIRRTAAPIGEFQDGSNAHAGANSGLPAISLPAGWTDDGMPVGLELLARPFDDERLVSLAYSLEQHGPQRRPPATTPEL